MMHDPRLPDEPIPVTTTSTTSRVPRFVKLIAVLSVVGLAGVVGVAWQLAAYRSAEQERSCERRVQTQEDIRAMWIWLGEQFPESAVELGLEAELDDRHPRLECIDGEPLPITEEP
jgi:hypothetical protein